MQFRTSLPLLSLSVACKYNIPVYGKQLQDYDVLQRDQELVAGFVNTTVLKNEYNYMIMQMNLAYKIDEIFIDYNQHKIHLLHISVSFFKIFILKVFFQKYRDLIIRFSLDKIAK